jgi:transmembrane sensor
MANANNDINELITRYLTGESSNDDQNQLFAWVNQSQENKLYFEQYRKTFDLTQKHFTLTDSSDLPLNIDEEWNRFTEATKSQKRVRKLSASQLWLRVAAAILLIAATTAILFYYSKDQVVIYQTAGNTQTVQLPDGSQVTLNRFTTLAYKSDFNKATRTLNLEGEAFFDDEPDAEKPFIIQTEKARVQVLGTSFNVNAYDSLTEVEVVVQTGIVSLESKQSAHAVKLTPGQKGIFSESNGSVKSSVNTDINFLSWRTQRLVFDGSDLASVIEALKKTYNARISVAATIPESCAVTVTFDGQTLESVLKVLQQTLNLKYTINGNKVVITEIGC